MYKIFHFSDANGEDEFLIISDRTSWEIGAEFGEGASLVQSLEIVGDAATFPCDRIMAKA